MSTKKWISVLACTLALAIGAGAQSPSYDALGAKLEEYFTALAGESPAVQQSECDQIIEACRDSLVRQYVTLRIYEHYLGSKIMGDDAVAVHIADKWLLSGAVPMHTDEDLLNAKVYAEFNRHSLIGMQAPRSSVIAPSGASAVIPHSKASYSAVYFYDTGCTMCKLESARLNTLVESGDFPLSVDAVYVGADEAAWKEFIAAHPRFSHYWDPEKKGDWQRLWGVLKTPQLVLVSPSGTILGRGLDTPALRILLSKEFSRGYTWGEKSQMERYDQLFSSIGPNPSVDDILSVADYLAARTFGEGDVESFRQCEGDLLYYISSKRTENFQDALIPFIQKYIEIPDVWEADSAPVQMAAILKDLYQRAPVGSQIPDITVPGILRRRPCLFSKDGKEDLYNMSKLGGKHTYVLFYSNSCPCCKEQLEAIDRLVASKGGVRVLLVNMDQVMASDQTLGLQLLDRFDLTVLPFALEMDGKGKIVHRYVQF
ncbi:MAG: redoxin domain-containing protein [Bacteroidales bacterium]|nr:redoxin domain-containing protein [Bacteroidales bacterium]